MHDSRGQIELLILIAIVILFAFFASGGLFPKKFTPPSPQDTTQVNTDACCDNGECNPTTTGKKFPFTKSDGQIIEYGLLKSDVTLREYNAHMLDSQKTTPDGLYPDGKTYPIVISTADSFGGRYNECGGGHDDQVWGNENPSTACTAIPNDSLIYVCKDKCTPPDRSYHVCAADPSVPCYGQRDAVYDIYYSIPQYQTDGSVPDVIKQCNSTASTQIIKQVIITPPPDPQPNLQLKKIDIQNVVLQSASAGWVSPYCKPAIYLYPEEKTNVSVTVAPKGKLTLAIPNYLQGGWNVTADPSGVIKHQNTIYDYLYYEAEIPDELIEKPKEGFVVEYESLEALFSDLLPKLGLNKKEFSQFLEYWLKALQKSPYYFVGIVPASNLNEIAPLAINPSPNTVIRVTLYFKALDEKVFVDAPTITTPSRDGFTVVEWGGIVKTDENHPFSCLM